MDVFECIQKRRTVHAYTNEPVSDLDLYKILEAGRWAPSAALDEPVRFIVVKDEHAKQQIYGMIKQILHMSYEEVVRRKPADLLEKQRPYAQGNIKMRVPVMVCVVADKLYTDTIYYSNMHHRSAACAAIQNMMLAARALELGTIWCTFVDPVRVQHLLKIPLNYEVVGVIPIGHPARFPDVPIMSRLLHTPARKDLTELAYSEQFGKRYSPPAGVSEK